MQIIRDPFLRDVVVDVDAAVVGIGKSRWHSVKGSEASDAVALQIMAENRFDVLPIEEEGGEVREYFCSDRWNNYDSVSRKRLTYEDVIPSNTSIRDVIRLLASKRRHFFFLTTENRVSGLVSVANLNCRQVRVFLYALLSELERRLGTLLAECLAAELIEGAVRGSSAAKRLSADQKRGVDADPIEYLDFPDLLQLSADHGVIERLDLATPDELDVDELRNLRNRVAHPIRSVSHGPESLGDLSDWIYLVEEMLFGLRLIQGPGIPTV